MFLASIQVAAQTHFFGTVDILVNRRKIPQILLFTQCCAKCVNIMIMPWLRGVLFCVTLDFPSSTFRRVTSRFPHIEKFSLNISNSSFVIRVNLLHPQPSLFLYGLSLSLWCFSILLNCYFRVSFNLNVILYVAKITQTVWKIIYFFFPLSVAFSDSHLEETNLKPDLIPRLFIDTSQLIRCSFRFVIMFSNY